MTDSSIHLKALKFDNPDSGPSHVVASFPVDVLYTVAALYGALPPLVFSQAVVDQLNELYNFVTGYMANRFFDDGLNDAMPAYNLFNREIVLAWHEHGSKSSDAPQQKLAKALDEALSDLIGGTDEKRVERAQLAALLSQTVINHGWRQVTPIRPHATQVPY